ncbi:hypothetical protein P171DRAFT_173773 [Karstenula rhodostoma CBS 690.94]|uniref:Uncharacterized protein n=1 Tax=Karstenula rhodostoma CBS 690.94 TaxID=1392251 RepID=A0A9P4U5L2_9PLEO|nr:hypothetical protein P171DRAFT_173773 [Karstenula rhodostoma CBS 690.94]
MSISTASLVARGEVNTRAPPSGPAQTQPTPTNAKKDRGLPSFQVARGERGISLICRMPCRPPSGMSAGLSCG